MFGSIGMPELIVILVIALLIFGPSRVPDVARSIGEAIRGFKKAMMEPGRSPLEKSDQEIKQEGPPRRD